MKGSASSSSLSTAGGGNQYSATSTTSSDAAGYGPPSFADDDDDHPCEKLRKESEEFCFLQQLKPAHDKAIVALKEATELYGKSSLRLVPFYLVLVEIALQERQLKQAEEVLSLVNWLLVKDRKPAGVGIISPSGPSVHAVHGHHHEDEPLPEEMKNLFVIRMNKLYSMLLMEYEAYTEALQRASHGAYHCALLFGPEHLYTSELYFCLGSVFSRMKQVHPSGQHQKQQRDNENALGMFDKVVDIWYRFLTNPPEETAAWMLEHQRLRILEASRMLQQIIKLRSAALGATHVATGEVLYTQGLVFLFLGDHTQAKRFVQQSLDVYSDNLVRSHKSTRFVSRICYMLRLGYDSPALNWGDIYTMFDRDPSTRRPWMCGTCSSSCTTPVSNAQTSSFVLFACRCFFCRWNVMVVTSRSLGTTSSNGSGLVKNRSPYCFYMYIQSH